MFNNGTLPHLTRKSVVVLELLFISFKSHTTDLRYIKQKNKQHTEHVMFNLKVKYKWSQEVHVLRHPLKIRYGITNLCLKEI